MDVPRVTIIYFLLATLSFVNLNVVCGEEQSVSKINSTSTPINGTIAPPEAPKPDVNNVAEGGKILIATDMKSNDTTHMGREHTIEEETSDTFNVSKTIKDATLTSKSGASSVSAPKSPEPIVLPVYETPEKNDNKKSVPKKGVEFSSGIPNINVSNIPKSTTTTTVKPKHKPVITETEDDNSFAPSNFEIKAKVNETIKNNVNEVPSIEVVTQMKKHRQADFVVPIVAAILLVPLFAIIISVLYKRGAEWWQHRHYRRMDFLIEGMYNN